MQSLPDMESGPSGDGERLHICVGPACNNNCIFCIEEDRETRFRVLANQTPMDVRRMLEAGSRARQAMFVSGEPTLNARLPEYVTMARDLGFASVGLITNGRRLAYRSYARTLLEAGLDHVLVSIHGPDAQTHDALTRTNGSYSQTLAGIANLASLKDEFRRLQVHTAFCVTRRNLEGVERFIESMRPYRIDQHVFNVMMPEGRGGRFFSTLMPRYRDVAAEFARLADALPPDVRRRVFLLDIPWCVTQGLPDSLRGWVERYFTYEMHGSCPVPGLEATMAEACAGGPGFQADALAGDRGSYLFVTKAAHDSVVRAKRPECARCRCEPACPGVQSAYADAFGWDEFEPVTGG